MKKNNQYRRYFLEFIIGFIIILFFGIFGYLFVFSYFCSRIIVKYFDLKGMVFEILTGVMTWIGFIYLTPQFDGLTDYSFFIHLVIVYAVFLYFVINLK